MNRKEERELRELEGYFSKIEQDKTIREMKVYFYEMCERIKQDIRSLWPLYNIELNSKKVEDDYFVVSLSMGKNRRILVRIDIYFTIVIKRKSLTLSIHIADKKEGTEIQIPVRNITKRIESEDPLKIMKSMELEAKVFVVESLKKSEVLNPDDSDDIFKA